MLAACRAGGGPTLAALTETSMAKLSIANLDLAGKRVVMRVDFNVPQD
ncbi:MAG: hypothetical protein RLZZ127_2698, partial [Planctomycetota bacterium]